MDDKMTAVGMVHVVKRDIVTGRILFDEWYKNTITNYARSQSAALWSGQYVATPSMISIGTGSNASGTTPNDTSLWNEMAGTRKNVDYATVWLNYYTQYGVTYQQSEAIGTVDPVNNPTGSIAITECGLWDANGNLWSHVALANVTHDNTSTLTIQWQVLQNGD